MQQRISFPRHSTSLVVTVVFVAAALAVRQAAADESENSTTNTEKTAHHWLTDFEEAAAEAKRLDVPLVVHFYADWCVPCQRMQREVLEDPELLDQLGHNFVGLKLNVDANEELAGRLNVRSLPGDVVIAPDGRVLAQTGGYQPRDVYLLNLSLAHSRFTDVENAAKAGSSVDGPVAGRTHTPRREDTGDSGKRPPSGWTSPDTASEPEPTTAENDDRPLIVARPTARSRWQPGSAAPIVAAPKPLLGLDGYSPVALFYQREWRAGHPRFAAVHKGIQYRMRSTEELEQFQAEPERFAPRLLGCDPVVLEETDRAHTGSTRHAAYFDDALYLFVSAESRARFKQDPLRYTTTRHVLLDEPEAVNRLR